MESLEEYQICHSKPKIESKQQAFDENSSWQRDADSSQNVFSRPSESLLHSKVDEDDVCVLSSRSQAWLSVRAATVVSNSALVSSNSRPKVRDSACITMLPLTRSLELGSVRPPQKSDEGNDAHRDGHEGKLLTDSLCRDVHSSRTGPAVREQELRTEDLVEREADGGWVEIYSAGTNCCAEEGSGGANIGDSCSTGASGKGTDDRHVKDGQVDRDERKDRSENLVATCPSRRILGNRIRVCEMLDREEEEGGAWKGLRFMVCCAAALEVDC